LSWSPGASLSTHFRLAQDTTTRTLEGALLIVGLNDGTALGNALGALDVVDPKEGTALGNALGELDIVGPKEGTALGNVLGLLDAAVDGTSELNTLGAGLKLG